MGANPPESCSKLQIIELSDGNFNRKTPPFLASVCAATQNYAKLLLTYRPAWIRN